MFRIRIGGWHGLGNIIGCGCCEEVLIKQTNLMSRILVFAISANYVLLLVSIRSGNSIVFFFDRS